MTEDAITLLDYIGWTAKRDINVVGISLGGMIAQGTSPYLLDFVPAANTTLKSWGAAFQNALLH